MTAAAADSLAAAAAAAAAKPSAADAEEAAAAAAEQQQQLQESRGAPVPRGPLPVSFLVLAEALDGSLCPLISDLTQQLVQQLLLLHEEHPCLFPSALSSASNGGPQGPPVDGGPSFCLEVEGRLGVIRERDSGARLRLPIETHAVLQPSFCVQSGGPQGGPPEGETGPEARFVAGISGAQFSDLKGLLLSVAARDVRAAEQRLQTHLALMGIEPGGGDATDEELEELNGMAGEGPCREARKGPQQRSGALGGPRKAIPWVLSGDDWRVLPEKKTEENYYHIPALQAAARFSSLSLSGGPSGKGQHHGFGGPPMVMGPSGGGPVSVQSLSQLLASPGIYKKTLLQWNVYSGADKDEAFKPTEEGGGPSDETADRTRVDYRLALNFEHKIELKDLQRSLVQQGTMQGGPSMGRGGPPGGRASAGGVPNTDPQLRRIRQRQSLVHRSGLRIDLTKVQQQNRPSWSRPLDNRREAHGNVSYEVEIELHPTQIAKAIVHKQQTGDPRPLWCLCATFLSLLRELAAPLNSPLGPRSGLGKGGGARNGQGAPSEAEWADLGDVQSTQSECAVFKRFLSDRLPLIGDYAYRAVAVKLQEKAESQEEHIPTLEEFMKEPGVEKKCLYTHNKTEVPGPWVPHKDADGRVHLIELKR